MDKECVVCQKIRKAHPELSDRELFARPTHLYRHFLFKGTSYCEVHLPEIDLNEIFAAEKKNNKIL